MRSKSAYLVPVLLVSAVAVLGLTFNPIVDAPESQEGRIVTSAVPSPLPAITPANYIEVIESCGPEYEGACVAVRSAPTSTAPLILELRTGVVLAVATTTSTDELGGVWYKVTFNEWIRYPARVADAWYVSGAHVRLFSSLGTQEINPELSSVIRQAGEVFGVIPEKRIVVDRSEQKLYAFEGDKIFIESLISTGLDLTPTPRGTFTIFRKTPSRYMQGPLPGISNQYYDLPGVPWNLYFTKEGGAIHGAYWHSEFGKQWSHGCVNLPPSTAQTLYEWAPLGTKVIVQD